MDSRERMISGLIERQERQRLLSELQAKAEKEADIPIAPPTILTRTSAVFRYTGGILLGAFLGALSLLINFLVFTYLLHLVL